MMAGEMDSLLMSLIEKEIPDGRNALLESHNNLADLSTYCKENYINSSDQKKALQETKEYASQSLASVAYQIHSLAVNILQMMDQQTIQLQKMQSNANNIGLLVDIHKEKVARREIGVLTSSKNFSRSHKVVPPAQQEKLKKYKREDIDYSILDHIGHGVKTERKEDVINRRFSTSSSSGSVKENSASSIHSSSQGSLQGLQTAGSLYQSTSSDRKAQFGNTMPPPPRPPVAPVAPVKPKTAIFVAPPAVAPPTPMAPPPPLTVPPPSPSMIPPPNIPAPPPIPPATGFMPVPPMPEPDYDDLNNHKDILPPPPSFPEIVEDIYQVPSNMPVAISVDDLPPPPPETFGGNNNEQFDHYDILPPTNMPPPPPMLTPEGHIIPDTYEEKVVAIYDYIKQRDDELQLAEGDVIYVIKKNEDGWFEGIKDGIQGLFPGNYVTPYM